MTDLDSTISIVRPGVLTCRRRAMCSARVRNSSPVSRIMRKAGIEFVIFAEIRQQRCFERA